MPRAMPIREFNRYPYIAIWLNSELVGGGERERHKRSPRGTERGGCRGREEKKKRAPRQRGDSCGIGTCLCPETHGGEEGEKMRKGGGVRGRDEEADDDWEKPAFKREKHH